MRVRLTLEADATICLESPYEARFVQELKLSIPWDGRQWQSDRKRWLVSTLYATELVAFLQQYGCQIQDERGTALTGGSGPPPPPMPLELREAFDVLYLQYTAPLCVAEASFKALARYTHPDKGGEAQQFHAVNDAIGVVRHYLDPKPEDGDDTDIPF